MIQEITAPDSGIADWAKLIFGVIAALGTLWGMVAKVLPWFRQWRVHRSLEGGPSAKVYRAEEIREYARYYIRPFCQECDPAQQEEPRHQDAQQEDLFSRVDVMLRHPTDYRYILLLAGTGMGKTTFCLNYYAHHRRRWKRKYDLVVLPLGRPDVDKRIATIKKRANTVLLLDALDEDTQAIGDHAGRVRDLLERTF